MSNIVNISNSNELADLVDSGSTVVVRFTADWCGPCKRFAPHFNAAAEKRPDVAWAVVDVDKSPDLTEQFGVLGIPYVVRIQNNDVRPLQARTVMQLLAEL